MQPNIFKKELGGLNKLAVTEKRRKCGFVRGKSRVHLGCRSEMPLRYIQVEIWNKVQS